MKVTKDTVVRLSVEMDGDSGGRELEYLHGGHAEEDGHRRVFRVTALSDTEATLDGNHPLAGRTVELRCEVLEVRAATQEEIEHGHVHGPHGHS